MTMLPRISYLFRASVNESELLSMHNCLPEAYHFNLQNIMVEGDSLYGIQWAAGLSNYPWRLANLVGYWTSF